jgi:hypothetical protein
MRSPGTRSVPSPFSGLFQGVGRTLRERSDNQDAVARATLAHRRKDTFRRAGEPRPPELGPWERRPTLS